MLENFIDELAGRMGLKLSSVSIADEQMLEGVDACILDLASGTTRSCLFVYRSELGDLERGSVPEMFAGRVRGALLRLQYLLEHQECEA